MEQKLQSTYLNQLQTDQTEFARILAFHQATPHPVSSHSARILRNIYLTILEDALKVINSLMQSS